MLSFSLPAQKGQGLVEYALILVLIAVVVIAALTLIGPKVSSMYTEAIGIFPSGASAPEPPPEPAEEPFGYPSQA